MIGAPLGRVPTPLPVDVLLALLRAVVVAFVILVLLPALLRLAAG